MSSSDIISIMENEFLSPFNQLLEKDKLFNLSLGCFNEGVDDLSNYETRKIMAENFQNWSTFIKSQEFSRTHKNKAPNFYSAKNNISRKTNESIIETNRNIIEKSLSVGVKEEHPIDYEKALSHLLHTVSLWLVYTDNSRRGSPKSQLLDIRVSNLITELLSK